MKKVILHVYLTDGTDLTSREETLKENEVVVLKKLMNDIGAANTHNLQIIDVDGDYWVIPNASVKYVRYEMRDA